MSVFRDDNDQRRWFVRSRWRALLHRPIPDEATMDWLITVLVNQGADAMEAMLETQFAEPVQLAQGEHNVFTKGAS